MEEKDMYREQIDAYIDSKKEEMLQDVMKLVRIDSQRAGYSGPSGCGACYRRMDSDETL